MSKFKTKLLGSFLLGIFMLTPSLGFSEKLDPSLSSVKPKIRGEAQASGHVIPRVTLPSTNTKRFVAPTTTNAPKPSVTTQPPAGTTHVQPIKPAPALGSPPQHRRRLLRSVVTLRAQSSAPAQSTIVQPKTPAPAPVSPQYRSLPGHIAMNPPVGLRAQSTSPVESQGKLVGWHGGGGGWRGGGGGWGGRGVYGGGWGGGYRNYGYGYGYPSYSYSYPSYSYSYPYYSSYYYW